jgi:hypothetical protein
MTIMINNEKLRKASFHFEIFLKIFLKIICNFKILSISLPHNPTKPRSQGKTICRQLFLMEDNNNLKQKHYEKQGHASWAIDVLSLFFGSTRPNDESFTKRCSGNCTTAV